MASKKKTKSSFQVQGSVLTSEQTTRDPMLSIYEKGCDDMKDESDATDICAYCANSDKLQPALYVCLNCSPYGRFMCGDCNKHHKKFGLKHDVKDLSAPVEDKGKNQDMLTSNKTVEKDKDLSKRQIQELRLERDKMAEVIKDLEEHNIHFKKRLEQSERELGEIRTRVNELTMANEKLKIQLEEKDKTVQNLRRAVEHLELKTGERTFADMQESEMSRAIRDETESLHNALRSIAGSVLNDTDEDVPDRGETTHSRTRSTSPRPRAKSPTFRARSKSPLDRSPAFADATFSAVQAALNKRQLQVAEARAKLAAQKDHNAAQRKIIDDLENEKRRLELIILNLKADLDISRRYREDTTRDRDRVKNALGLTSKEKQQLEKVRRELNDQIEQLNAENEKLQAANTELQKQRDNLEDDKSDIIKDKDRQIKENERCQRIIEQQEHKNSSLKEELVATKEALNRALLDREVLYQQRQEVGEALSKAEMVKTELEGELHKSRSEEAALKYALVKMQALSEGLGQDKIKLNRIIMLMEAEKAAVYGVKQALEQERSGIREELVRVKQEKMDLDTEKAGLNQTLELSEMTRQQLEEEIGILNREKADVTEQLNAESEKF